MNQQNYVNDPLLQQLDEHQKRVLNDVELQRRRKASRDATNRVLLPALIICLLLAAVFWVAMAWFLGGIFSPLFCAGAFLTTCAGGVFAVYAR